TAASAAVPAGGFVVFVVMDASPLSRRAIIRRSYDRRARVARGASSPSAAGRAASLMLRSEQRSSTVRQCYRVGGLCAGSIAERPSPRSGASDDRPYLP